MEQPISNTPSKAISETTPSETTPSNAISETTPSETTLINTTSDPLSNAPSKQISGPPSEEPPKLTIHEYIAQQIQGYFICGLSVCSLMSSLYGLQRNVQLSYVPMGLFITSVNYWRNPTRGIRRNIDIMAVGFGIVTHLYSSTKTNQQGMYGTSMCICGVLYGISWYLYKKGYSWSSTISHVLIHIVANIANVLLYNRLSEFVL